jgi:hypothetical protein
MNVALPLDQMTTGDKIRTMECLWDDLCRHAETFESPVWHSDVLSEREENVLLNRVMLPHDVFCRM